MLVEKIMQHVNNIARGVAMGNAMGASGETASCGVCSGGEGGQARITFDDDCTDSEYSPSSIRSFGMDATTHRQSCRQEEEQQARKVNGHVAFEAHRDSSCAYDSDNERNYKYKQEEDNEEDDDDSYFNPSQDWTNDEDDDGTTGLIVPCREDVVARLIGMLKGESRMTAPRSDYIETVQCGGMSSVWRTRTCEWLLEMVDQFHLTVDTICVAVFNVDRYMSNRTVDGCIVQLVAIAAVMVASKIHEPHPLQVNDVQWLAEGIYCESDIRLMELDLLHTIGWDANPVTSYQFMRHLSLLHPDFHNLHTLLQPIHLLNNNQFSEERNGSIDYNTRMRTIGDHAVGLYEDFEARCVRAEWFLDLAMLDYAYLVYPQSVQAHAAVACVLATQGLDPGPWAASVCAVLGPDAIDLDAARRCADSMMEVYHQSFSRALKRNGTDHQEGLNNNSNMAEVSTDISSYSSTSSNEEHPRTSISSVGKSINNTHVREDLLVHCDNNGVLGAGDNSELYTEEAMRQMEVASPDCIADLFSPTSQSSAWAFMPDNIKSVGSNGNNVNKAVLHYDCNSNQPLVGRGGGNDMSKLAGNVPPAVCTSGEEGDELVSSIEKQLIIGSPVHIWDARATSFASSSSSLALKSSSSKNVDVPTLSSSGATD